MEREKGVRGGRESGYKRRRCKREGERESGDMEREGVLKLERGYRVERRGVIRRFECGRSRLLDRCFFPIFFLRCE